MGWGGGGYGGGGGVGWSVEWGEGGGVMGSFYRFYRLMGGGWVGGGSRS